MALLHGVVLQKDFEILSSVMLCMVPNSDYEFSATVASLVFS